MTTTPQMGNQASHMAGYVRKEKTNEITKDKNLLDNPKEEKTRFGLVGRKVYRKVFSTFDLLVLTEFS